ncbi:MAG: ATP-dependent helicase [Chloroflexota bacterium]|nr:MAG: ATP-dependent helicase [Chloroflexota bacterium]
MRNAAMTGQGDGLTLSDIQRQAVEAPKGKWAFLGGPGAGKTLVIGQRAIRLVAEGIAPADRVLVLAPAGRAARALRVQIQTGLRGAAGPRATSFYGLALAIVESHYRALGYARSPRILSTNEHRHLLRQLLRQEDPARWDLTGRSISSALENLVYNVVMGVAQNLLSMEEALARMESWGQWQLAELSPFHGRYRERLRRDGVIDIGEALVDAARLLATQPAVAEEFRQTYRYILVDELEEANHVEFQILTHLTDAGTDLLVAGDPAQAINSYRSGTAAHLLSCQESLGTRILASNENFRSGPRVAAFSGVVRPKIALPDDSTAAHRAELSLQNDARGRGESYVVLRPFAYPSDEARWVAEEVQSQIEAGVPPTRIAILVRTQSVPMVRLIVSELSRRGVIVRTPSSRMLLGDPLVRATFDLLRCLSVSFLKSGILSEKTAAVSETAAVYGGGPTAPSPQSGTDLRNDAPNGPDEDSRFLWRLLDSPLVGLPPFGLRELKRALSHSKAIVLSSLTPETLQTLPLSPEVSATLTAFLERLSALQSKLDHDAATLLWEIWRLFPAFRDDALAGGTSALAYRALLEEISSLPVDGRRVKPVELLRYLEDGYFERIPAPSPRGGGVLVGTVHQSKGQHWEVVFLPGLTEGSFPLQASSQDIGALLSRDVDGELAAGPGSADMNVLLRRLRAAEEQRVFHVAVSRARRGLYLSYSRRGADGGSAELPSRFLDPVPMCSAVEVVSEAGEDRRPLNVEGAVAHYRRLLASADPLQQCQSAYALHHLRQSWTQAVRPEEWWENVDRTEGAAPPFPDGRLYLSATRLSSYRNCPLSYQFGQHWGLSDPDGPALTMGSLLHKVLEEYHRPGTSHPQTRETLQELLEKHLDPGAFPYKPIARQARKKISQWLDDYYRHFGQATSALAVEKSFSFALGPHSIRGYIDRIDRLNTGDLELIDYKTSSAMSKAEAEQDLQLALYDLAFYEDTELRSLGRPSRVSYLYLKNIGVKADGKRSYQPTDDTRTRLRSRVQVYAGAIVNELFPPRRSLAEALPGLDAFELERARKGSCMFCGFGWVCSEEGGGEGAG